MFAMQSKELDSVFVERVLGVFVPNLVILLVNARPTRSCEDSPRLFPNAQYFFGPESKVVCASKTSPHFIVSLNSLAK